MLGEVLGDGIVDKQFRFLFKKVHKIVNRVESPERI